MNDGEERGPLIAVESQSVAKAMDQPACPGELEHGTNHSIT